MKQDFDAFFKANERRVHYQIHRLGITGEWYEEFYTEGIVALWQAYKEFDEEKGKIGTFLNYRIRFRLIDLVRKKSREQEVLEDLKKEKSIQLSDGNRHKGSGMPLVKVSGIVLEDHAFWEEIRSKLSNNQWKWVKYFIIAELTIKEIMELESVTADAVKGWGQAVRIS
ncbi:sigma-70 family RNA polymerase sigma factor [Pseudogracilibacillus sp. SE30717A]|uniref:sigma-70 family RNA polymerase sigma factor n=1 Tax=Pseudogracilibacillus sp. SE30717A TaxID=3098293 RepID=UPI00300DCEE1